MTDVGLEYKIVTDESGAIKGLKKVRNETDKTDKEFQKASNSSKGFMSNLSGLGGLIGGLGLAFGASELLSFGKSAIMAGAEMESMKMAFQTLTQSVELGNKVFADLVEFANVTPFETKEVTNAGKALLAFGIEAKDVAGTLQMLGDVQATSGSDLSGMARIFGKITQNGRLMGDELNQLIDRGFNPLGVISEKTGKSVAELRKDMEKGLITTDMVTDAFKTATSEGGKFYQMMDKQSKTLSGRWSTLKGKFDNLVASFSMANNGVLKNLVMRLTEIVDIIPMVDFSSMFEPFAVYGDIIGTVFDSFSQLFSMFGGEGLGILDKFQFAISAIGIAFKVILGPMILGLNVLTGIVKMVVNTITSFHLLVDATKMAGSAIASFMKGDFSGGKLALDISTDKLADFKKGMNIGGEFDKMNKNTAKFFGFGDDENDKSTPMMVNSGTTNTATTPMMVNSGLSSGGLTNTKTTTPKANTLSGGGGKGGNTVTIKNLIENLTINVGSMEEGYKQIKTEVERLLIESTNRIAG